MVNRYREQVQGWELWNEENIEYWQPHAASSEMLVAKGKQYGKALCRFADVVHEIRPKSKVIFGGTSFVDPVFVLSAIESCPTKIDVMVIKLTRAMAAIIHPKSKMLWLAQECFAKPCSVLLESVKASSSGTTNGM
jgi:hypothetical protein